MHAHRRFPPRRTLRRTGSCRNSAVLGINYQRQLKNKIKELVKKNSKKEYSDEKVETFVD